MMSKTVCSVVVALVAISEIALGAEIKLYSTIATKSVVEDLAPKFEKASGHKVVVSFANMTGIVKRVRDGEVPDVVIGNRDGMDVLSKDGKLQAGSLIPLANSGLSVAVRKGASKPDIATPEAFKRTLLAAKSITYNNPKDGGASGAHIAKVIERLGIAKELQQKTVYAGNESGALVATGKAELGMTQTSSLVGVAGIDVVGPFPGDLQATTQYAVAIGAGTKNAGAKALIDFLRSAESAKTIKAKGLDPL